MYTVLAPTNDAFTNIDFPPPIGLPQLRDILKYHVIEGIIEEDDITDGQKNTTLIGEDVTFTLPNTGPKVNDVNIIDTDIEATNGIIDVLDAVLQPSSVTSNLVDKLISAAPEFTTLVGLVGAAGLVDALKDLSPLTVFGK